MSVDSAVVAMKAEARTPRELPLVVAVTPVFNRCEKTFAFLKRASCIEYPRFRVIIVDDGSSDGTDLTIAMSFPEVQVFYGDGSLWWAGGTNLGIRAALDLGADYILTINDDCRFEPGFLARMVDVAIEDPKRIVGCRIMREDDEDVIWSLGTTVKMRGEELFELNYAGRRWTRIQQSLPPVLAVDCMPGNSVLLPREVFERVGFYDEREMPQYHADSDLVLRAARAGFKPIIATGVPILNHIITVPLVDNRVDLVFSKKSDRYWRAVWRTIRRNAPFWKAPYLFLVQYARFFLPEWIKRPLRAWKRARSRAES